MTKLILFIYLFIKMENPKGMVVTIEPVFKTTVLTGYLFDIQTINPHRFYNWINLLTWSNGERENDKSINRNSKDEVHTKYLMESWFNEQNLK